MDENVICYLDGPCGNHGQPGSKRSNPRDRGCWPPRDPVRNARRATAARSRATAVSWVGRWERCVCREEVFTVGPPRAWGEVRCATCAAEIAWRVALLQRGLRVVWN